MNWPFSLYPGTRVGGLSINPDLRQALAEIVTGCHVPAPQISRGHDDPVPPQNGNAGRLIKRTAFKLAHDAGTFTWISGDGLADIERIQIAIGRTGMVGGRKIRGEVFGQLKRGIIEIITGEIKRGAETAMYVADSWMESGK